MNHNLQYAIQTHIKPKFKIIVDDISHHFPEKGKLELIDYVSKIATRD